MASLITNKVDAKYIGRCEMGYCGNACREFIENLSGKECHQWSMINIRALTTDSNSGICLQDLRGSRVTGSHVFMINTFLPKLNPESEFSRLLSCYKVYDPLYDMEFKSMLSYVCFFYSKINFDQFDSCTDNNLKVGDNVIMEIQKQSDYENTSWTTDTYGNCSRIPYPTGTFMFDTANMIKLSGINIIDTTNKEMELFKKKSL
jgi:hypothetical protein